MFTLFRSNHYDLIHIYIIYTFLLSFVSIKECDLSRKVSFYKLTSDNDQVHLSYCGVHPYIDIIN